MKTTRNRITSLLAGLLLLVFTACGGGGGGSAGGGNGGPSPSDSGSVSGTLTGDSQLVRSTSQQGDSQGVAGVDVTARRDGQSVGSDTTDSNGNFNIDGVPAGPVNLSFSFETNADFDGNGTPDRVSVGIPTEVDSGQATQVLEQLGLSDTDGDGNVDSVTLDGRVERGGQSQSHVMGHNPQTGRTTTDSDGDGNVDSNDASFEDSDGDGVPDNLNGLAEIEVKGTVQNKTQDRLTVGGVEFVITPQTIWLGEEGGPIVSSDVPTGSFVEVKGRGSAQGTPVATRVKLEDQSDDDNSDQLPDEVEFKGTIGRLTEDSVLVRGVTFLLTDQTTVIGDNDNQITPGDLQSGMFVEIKGTPNSDGDMEAVRINVEEIRGSGADENEVEFTGVIDSIDGDSYTIGGQTWDAADAECLNDEGNSISCDQFQEGQLVEVEGFRNSSGDLIAEKIKREDEGESEDDDGDGDDDGFGSPDRHVEDEGTIESVDGNRITVNGQEWIVARAECESTEDDINCSQLQQGWFVEIEGFQNGEGNRIATEVEQEERDDESGDTDEGDDGDEDDSDDDDADDGDDGNPGNGDDGNPGNGGEDNPGNGGDDNPGNGGDDNPGNGNDGDEGDADDNPGQGDDNPGQGDDDTGDEDDDADDQDDSDDGDDSEDSDEGDDSDDDSDDDGSDDDSGDDSDDDSDDDEEDGSDDDEGDEEDEE